VIKQSKIIIIKAPSSAVGRSIIGGGGGHIYILVFTDLKNNQFQKKFMTQHTNI
jgi:hypothetical protein